MGAPRLSISSGAIIIMVIHMMATMDTVRQETITDPGPSLLPLHTSLVNSNHNRKQLNTPLLPTIIVTKSL